MTIGLRYLWRHHCGRCSCSPFFSACCIRSACWVVGQVAFRRQCQWLDGGAGWRQPSARHCSDRASTGAEWFHPRPSAAGNGYDALASGASNLAPSSQELLQLVEERRDEAVRANGTAPILGSAGCADRQRQRARPAHLTRVRPSAGGAGGSSAEPRPRGGPCARRRAHQGRSLGFLGEPTVNVLELNLASLDLAGTLEE